MDQVRPRKETQRPLPAIWVKGKSSKDKEDIEYILRNNKIMISALLKILTEMEDEELRAERDGGQYDTPSWSHKQADRNGALRTYAKVKQLFSFLES